MQKIRYDKKTSEKFANQIIESIEVRNNQKVFHCNRTIVPAYF